MRVTKMNGDLSVRAISGSRIVLMTWDLPAAKREGLRGFAIRRKSPGDQTQGEWLQGLKYFKELVPAPVKGASYSSRKHPFQTFLWSEYTLDPDTEHSFTIVALYGAAVHNFTEGAQATVKIRTEKEDDGKHGIWFNRGVIASHAFAAKFQNKKIKPETFEQLDAKGDLLDDEVRWLSRGLAEACLAFIRNTKSGQGLRVCAYEFTYAPVLEALRDALERGVDVQIVYHDTKQDDDANRAAMKHAKLAKTYQKHQVLFPRTRTKIPHNKFIVRLVKGKPHSVWTGSTNFTSGGFFGQTNVAHVVTDADIAEIYLNYWQSLTEDPTLNNAVAGAMALTPNVPNVLPPNSVTAFYSPRIAENALDWYRQRISDARAMAAITLPFNVAPEILNGLKADSPSLRLAVLENPPGAMELKAQKTSGGRLLFSNGALLGKSFVKHAKGGATVKTLSDTSLDQWFLAEELARPANTGHVFFVHSKFVLIDPLSNDPLVCSGSANFSKNSLIANDENMIFVRGDTRVADIYLTEFDRIFRHFYARDAINDIATKGNKKNPLELDIGSDWVVPYYKNGSYKNNRRLLFFPAGATGKTWDQIAKKDPDPFEDEKNRADARKKGKSAARKKPGAAKPAAKKKPAAKRAAAAQ